MGAAQTEDAKVSELIKQANLPALIIRKLNSQTDDQLKKWAQLKNDDLPKVSELIKQANLPALIITEPKKT